VGELGEWNGSTRRADGQMLATHVLGGRVLVARLDPAGPGVRVLGAISTVYECHPGPRAVVCRRSDHTVGVWYPRDA
jgi:hypothetical protein